ncbi:MAG TPA: response regulator [Planctomycetaceae bacterium]|nr:response regulator [Planctomycetaceae bacterium]
MLDSTSPFPSQPTVYVVDDDQATRKSLRWLVETLGVPVQTFHSGVSFLDSYDPSQPGCLVLDVMMAGMTGLELQKELNERKIQIPVIVLTGYGDVPTAVRALKNGAVEFLEKPFDGEVLLEQIRRALGIDADRRRERDASEVVRLRLAKLTPREREILKLVVDGLSSKEIATQLEVSFKTVEAHRAKIMRKMEANGVAQLVRMVVTTTDPGRSAPGDTNENPSDE